MLGLTLDINYLVIYAIFVLSAELGYLLYLRNQVIEIISSLGIFILYQVLFVLFTMRYKHSRDILPRESVKTNEIFDPVEEKHKIMIQYFALRDKDNNYLGCLEASQDITDILKIEGEKRLLD